MALPGDVHLLRCRHAVRRAGLLADQQRVQPLPHIVAGVRIPDPGSPAAADKEKRDHRNENARRAKAGLPSLEEEALAKAKEEAERKATQAISVNSPCVSAKRSDDYVVRVRCSRETFNTHRHYFLCSGEQGLDLEFKHDMKE